MTIVQMILEKAQQSVPKDWGIELIDVRIKRINYVETVRREVFRPDDFRAGSDCRKVPVRGARRSCRYHGTETEGVGTHSI